MRRRELYTRCTASFGPWREEEKKIYRIPFCPSRIPRLWLEPVAGVPEPRPGSHHGL